MSDLHLSATQAEVVRCALRSHLPAGSTVRVFGSRATGRALKPHSDLDLLIDTPTELPLSVLGNLREAFSESELPFTVDLLQRSEATPGFLVSVERDGTLELLRT